MEGRWTITKTSTDSLAPPYRDHILGPETGPMEVMPCDDAAIDRTAVALFEAFADEFDCWDHDPLEPGRRWRPLAEAVLRAAGETP